MNTKEESARENLSQLAAEGTAAQFGFPRTQLLSVRRAQWAGAREVISAIYRTPVGAAGCCLHVVVDDGNTDDESIEICFRQAIKSKHVPCRIIVAFLRRLTRAQRRAFLRVRR